MKTMIIDVGSNTVKYDVFSTDSGVRSLKSAAIPVRMLSCIKDGELSNEGTLRLIDALTEFQNAAAEEGCREIHAFGTAGMRALSDPQKTVETVAMQTGVTIRVLSGEEEAAFSFAGMTATMKDLPECGLMLDMGGASTEFNFFCNGKSLYLHSCPFGALKLKTLFATDRGLNEKEREALERFLPPLFPPRCEEFSKDVDTAVLVGGTSKACAKLARAFLSVNGPLSAGEWRALTAILRAPDDEQYETMRRLCPERYQLMAAGAAAFEAIFDTVGIKRILFSSGGIREGCYVLTRGKPSPSPSSGANGEAVGGDDRTRANGEAGGAVDRIRATGKAGGADDRTRANGEKDALVFEGMISLRALIDARKYGGRPIFRVVYSRTRLEKHEKEYKYLLHRAEEGLFTLELADDAQIAALASGKSHGGVLALCGERAYPPLPQTLPDKGFFVMIEGIEDPFNFGYALRSLYAAGVDGVILTGGVRTGADGVVCRSSAGASERMEIFLSSPETAVDFFRDRGYRVVCADQPDSIPVYDADLKRPLLLIVGGEKRGITRAVLEKSDAVVRLEYGRDFSAALSAASAASILAFEVFRQNRE